MVDSSPDLERIVAALEELVSDLTAQGLEKLPPERELAVRFGVARNRIRTALARLEAADQVVRVKGRAGGAYIKDIVHNVPIPPLLFDSQTQKVRRDLTAVKGVPQMLEEQGYTSETRVLSESLEPAPAAIAEPLGLAEGDATISLLRLRLADGLPLSLERMYLDPERFPRLLDHGPILSLYALLETRYGITIASTDESIEVTQAPRQVATLLGIRAWSPVLALRRIGRDADGAAVEVSIDLFRADRTRLSVRTGSS